MSDIQSIWDPKMIFSWKIIQIVNQDRQRWGKIKTFEYAERAPWVRIIIVDKDGRICLTEEWRAELNWWVWWHDIRLPGGKVFDKLTDYVDFQNWDGDLIEQAKETVKREAKEEVWIIPKRVQHLHTSICGATMKRDLIYFLVDDFELNADGQDLWDREDIEILRSTSWETKKYCLDGSIQEDRSVAVLLRYIENELS